METQIVVALIGGVVVIVGGILAWLRFFRKDRAEVASAEIANEKAQNQLLEEMSERVVKAAREKFENEQKIADAEKAQKKAEDRATNLQTLLDFSNERLRKYEELVEKLYTEIGGSRESEKRCREDLDRERNERKEENQRLLEKIEALAQKAK